MHVYCLTNCKIRLPFHFYLEAQTDILSPQPICAVVYVNSISSAPNVCYDHGMTCAISWSFCETHLDNIIVSSCKSYIKRLLDIRCKFNSAITAFAQEIPMSRYVSIAVWRASFPVLECILLFRSSSASTSYSTPSSYGI